MEKFISHRSWRKYVACLKGSTEAAQSKVQAERPIGPGAHAFIRVLRWNASRSI